jgi:hypothetical protein
MVAEPAFLEQQHSLLASKQQTFGHLDQPFVLFVE